MKKKTGTNKIYSSRSIQPRPSRCFLFYQERKNGDDGAASPDESPPGSPPKLSDTELRRIRQIVREDELRCLKCHKQYSTVSYLHRHAVRHLGWRRFKCKLCKFTAYNRSECTTHLRKVHRAKTMGVRDMNPFIHDLEPEKMKQEPTVLTRVERTVHCHNDSLHSVSQPPASVAATTANNACTNAADNYNISTRRNRRVFDTKPYTREEQEEDDKSDSETKDDDDDVDDESGALTTLRTRGGAYTKPDLLKRKRDESDDDDEEKSAKRKRTHSGIHVCMFVDLTELWSMFLLFQARGPNLLGLLRVCVHFFFFCFLFPI